MEGIAAQSPPSPSSCRSSASSNKSSSWLFALAHRSNNSSSSPGGNNSLSPGSSPGSSPSISPSSSRNHHKTAAAAATTPTKTSLNLVIPEQIAVYNVLSLPNINSNSQTNSPESHLLLSSSNGSPSSYGSYGSAAGDHMPRSPMFLESGVVPLPTASIVLPHELDRPGTPTTMTTILSEPLSAGEGGGEGGDHASTSAASSSSPSSSVCGDHCGSSRDSKLSLTGLAVMVFYSVSGGPFGVETSVRSAGNFYTLLGFLVFPFVWSVQEAMMTAELGAAFPEASGGVAWVEEAFGSKWGFMSGYLGWIAGATDNAIYPVLFLDYLLQVVNTQSSMMMNSVVRFVMLAITSMMLSYVNWMGLPVVGNMSIAICALAMSPFVVLTIWGAFKVDPSRWLEGPTHNMTIVEAISDDDGVGILPVPMMGGVLLRPFLNNLFWNLNSFDAGASFAEDIDNPGKVLPRAMGYSIVMVVLGYLLPLLVALGASDSNQADWVDGYLAKACSDIVAPWLGAWTVFAAGISNIALFQAELSADAFQLMGMAERGHLPEIFATRSRHGTPTYGILLGCGMIVALGAANVDRLIEMLNFNYSVSLLMEYAAFIKLRISRPDLPRPFKIPLNTFWCIMALVPTVFFTLLILALADLSTYAFAIAVNAAGFGLYRCMRQIRERQDHHQPIIPLVYTDYLCSRGSGGGTGGGDSPGPRGKSETRRTGGIIRGKKYERVDSTDVATVQTEDDTETRCTASSIDNTGSISDTSVISQIIRSSSNGVNNSNNVDNNTYDDHNNNTSSSQEHR